jgi:hypothetical protein
MGVKIKVNKLIIEADEVEVHTKRGVVKRLIDRLADIDTED